MKSFSKYSTFVRQKYDKVIYRQEVNHTKYMVKDLKGKEKKAGKLSSILAS
jgi:hypothetical protein